MSKSNQNQPSLFDEAPAKEIEESTQPEWEFPFLPHVDLIGDERVSAFTFQIDRLPEKFSDYTWPIYHALLSAFAALPKQKKSMRDSSFTVYGGDIPAYELYGVGIGGKNGDVINFVADYLRNITGYYGFESGSSREFVPIFRYDKGYVIEYSDEGLEGTQYVDDEQNYASGLTIYRRYYVPPEYAGKNHSSYGILKRCRT